MVKRGSFAEFSSIIPLLLALLGTCLRDRMASLTKCNNQTTSKTDNIMVKIMPEKKKGAQFDTGAHADV